MPEQKLNIVFTGDVSQLNKAITSAEAELASFENAVKGITGFDLSGLSQQIDSIRQKFASIKVNIDPGKALTELDRISSETAKLKDVVVDVDVNTSGVFAEIDSIVKKIKGIDLGSLSFPDIQNATSEINKVLAELSKLKDTDVLLKVDNAPALAAIDKVESDLKAVRGNIIVQVDATKLNSDLQDIKAKFSALQEIDIKADPSGALAAIDKILSEINSVKSQDILLEADNSEALSSINDIQKRIEGIKSSITLSVDVDAAISSIKSKFQTLGTIDIKADPQQALTAINEILTDISKLKSNEILLQSDNSDVLSDIDQIQKRLQDVKSTIKISADLDTSKLESLLKPLSTQVSVTINTKAAEAEIKALLNQVKGLKGQDILINLDGTQVIKTIDSIEKELLQLQAKLKTATNPADIAKLTQQLQLFKNSLSANNVNQFSSSVGKAQQATFAFSQVLREAPSFAFSLQTGLLGISNNLPILADRFKEAKASGLSTGKIFTEMAKGLVSLPGLMTIASTAAIFLAGAFNKSGDKAEDAAVKIRTYGQIVGESTAGVQGDIAQIDALVNAFKEAGGSFDKQNRIIKELKNTNEAYFGDLKAGKTTYEEVAAAANKYTEALVAQAIVKGFSDEISKVSTELSKQRDLLKPLAVGVSNLSKELLKIKDPEARERQRATNRQTLEYEKQLDVVTNLKGEFNRLFSEMQTAVDESLKFKLFKGDPLPKDETDAIIAKARAFVKQFGEVFVVPDLDESFTNTKDKILKSAKQLLDDVKNLNLKIKLPVVTEIDFLPENTGTPIPQAELDALQKAMFDQLKAEFQEPFIVDLSIQPEVDVQKAKERFKKAVQDGRFEDALNEIDAKPKVKGFQELEQSVKTMAKSINETLTPAFQNFFDALIQGENPIKAFFDSIIQSINQVIKKLIQAAIQAAILSALSGPSGAGFGSIFKGLLGFGGQANFGNGGAGSLRALSVNVTGSVIQRGTDTIISFNNSGRSLGRIQ